MTLIIHDVDKQKWNKILNAIKDMEVIPLVIRDTETTFSENLFEGVIEVPVASVHLPFRFALYEHSLLNFTRNNGPSTLMLYGNAPSIFLVNLILKLSLYLKHGFRKTMEC